jgi:hypothetical protein
MMENQDWSALRSVLSAPARMIGIDPRVRDLATQQMCEALAPMAATELSALDHHERACEETWGVLAGVSSDAGLDQADGQQAVDDRQAERIASDAQLRSGSER